MATKKISELEEINQAENDDYLVVVDTSESKNKKITKENFLKISALEEKISDLENNQLTASTEGTSIDINDSADYQVREMIPNGNVIQNSTTGKNKFAGADTTVDNGITFTKNSDGSYNIVGTSTSQANAYNYVDINNSGLVNGQTYTFWASQVLPAGFFVLLEAYNGTTWQRHVMNGLKDVNQSESQVIDLTDTTRIRFTLRVNVGYTVNISNLKIQLESGSTATNFEKYTGGIASPNPQYEQPINSAGDNINLFDKTANITRGYTYTSTGGTTQLNNCFVQEKYIEVESSKDYILSTTNSYISETDYRLVICEYDSSKNFIKRNLSSTQYYKITTSATTKYVRLCASTVTIDELKFEHGSIATPYSPYGMGSINEVISNKNLLENTYTTSGTQGGITHAKNTDGTMLLNGTATTTVFMILNTFNLAAGTYILSGCPNGGSENGYRQDILVGSNVITRDFGSGGSFTLNESTSIQARIRIGSGTAINNLTFKPMIIKGSIVKQYSPYGMGSINEVISNKNSLPVINGSYTSYELTTNWEGNTATINGTCIQTYSNFMGSSLIPIYLTADEYTISASDYTYNYTFRFQLKDGTIENTNIVGRSSTIEFTQDVVAYRCWIYRSDLRSVTFSNYKVSFQIEKGSTSTSFVSHQEQNISIPCQQPMRSIGNVRDEFVKIDGTWYEKHNIGQVVLNGSESGWVERGNTSENYIKFRNANALPYDIKGDLLLISDYFVTNIGANNASYSGNAICGNSGNYAKWLHISIDNTIVNSVETFKTWLSTHNTEVIYQLAEPIYLECTEEQITALEQARTYKPVTHISSADVVPAYLGVTYVRDLETVINNLS